MDATSVKNIVRVHGAYFDCSGLEPVDEVLVKGGYHVRVVQEPLASLKVASTKRVVALQPGPRILVAHSYGGTVPTEAGIYPRVVG